MVVDELLLSGLRIHFDYLPQMLLFAYSEYLVPLEHDRVILSVLSRS